MKTGTSVREGSMMKKTLFLVAALVSLAACTSRLETDIPEANMTLIAKTESPADTRTVVEGETHVYWEPGDEIAVFSGGQKGVFYAEISKPSDTAPFRGYLENGSDGSGMDLWAVYPYSWDASYENERITTVLPARQEARPASFGRETNLAIAHSSTGTLQFYNVGGGVRFSVQEDGIREVVFQGMDGEILAGKVQIGFQDGRPAVLDVLEGKCAITLTPPYGQTFIKDTWYYFVALPGALEKGFVLDFFKENEHGGRVFDKSVTIKRSIYGTLTHADEGLAYSDCPDGVITFKDSQVKSILVRHFDLDNDGRISVHEAAVVRSFLTNKAQTRADDGKESIFAGSDITSFNEMAYFTSLTRIEEGVFAGCTGLTSVTLPESVTSIGDHAFNGCTGLESITVLSPTPPAIGTDVFADTGDCPISVPEDVVDQYVLAWYEYAPRIQAVQEPPCPTPEAVDLGLPSGTRWASFNLGASKPEEYGDYYAWGETRTKSVFGWSTYAWYKKEDGKEGLTRYCPDSRYGFEGFQDDKWLLDPEDDAAYVKLGGDWRMPTAGDWDELGRLCTLEWITLEDVTCAKLTGPNGNSIILPPGGGSIDGDDFEGVGELGGFWASSTANVGCAWFFGFYKDLDPDDVGFPYPGRCLLTEPNVERSSGLSIRPVCGPAPVLVENVLLEQDEVSLNAGETVSLTASVLPGNATHKALLWVSDNEKVATVSSSGEVKGVGVGETVIYAVIMDGLKVAQCTVSVGIPDAVDLGLPSGIKWASTNLGSYPYGDYYAWGETSPHYKAGGAQSDSPEWEYGFDQNGEFIKGYDWRSYGFVYDYQQYDENHYSFSLSKYRETWYNSGDGLNILEPEDDAAHELLGGEWRIPSYAEMNELRNTCSWEWTVQDGVSGQKVTGPSGNSIFLPAAGYRTGQALQALEADGLYWSSSRHPSSSYAIGLNFDADGVYTVGGYSRFLGYSIRPVQGRPPVPVESISLDKTALVIKVGESAVLNATLSPSDATFGSYSWTSSNSGKVTLSRTETGMSVTGVAPGFTYITVFTHDGGKEAICEVTVVDPVDILVEDLAGSYTCSSSMGASEQPWTIEIIKDQDDNRKVWFYNLFAQSGWSSDDTVFFGTVDETNGTVTIPYGQQSVYLYQGETPITLFWLDTEGNYDVTGSNTVIIRKDDSGKVIGLDFDETLGFVGRVGDLGYVGYAYPAITADKEGVSASSAPRRQGKSLSPKSLGGSLLERPD